MYNDNNLLKWDNRTMVQRFTNMRNISMRTKFIVRDSINNLLITSSHIPPNINYWNSKGEFIFPKSYIFLHKENNPMAYIKHFYTKTAEEYCNKINNGDVQFENANYKNEFKIHSINVFFIIIIKPKKKWNYQKSALKINNYYSEKIVFLNFNLHEYNINLQVNE